MTARSRGGLFEAEFIGPRHHGAKQKLIIGNDDEQHRQQRVSDRWKILLLDGERDVRADSGQRHRGVADGDRFRGHHEKPATRHRHHRVPDQARHRERHIEPPEPLPAAEMKAQRGFIEVFRHVAHRLVHAERHVPGLAGEDREHAGEFGPEHAAGKQVHEKNDGEGQKAEDRHRLQDIQKRDQHHLGAPALGREGRVDEGEDDRADDRQQHPHGGAQRIERKVGRIERHRGDVERRQRCRGLSAAIDDQHHGADHENQRDEVPDVGPQRPDIGTQRLPQRGRA